MSDQPKPASDALLGDLESIRDLFDAENQGDALANDDRPAQPVPELDGIEEPSGEPLGDLLIPEVSAGLNSELFDALLGEHWRDTVNHVLEQARDTIQDNAEHWAPADTDDLNAALKVRIDETVQGWLRGILIQHMDNLHEQLLGVLADELPSMIDSVIAGRAAGQVEGDQGG